MAHYVAKHGLKNDDILALASQQSAPFPGGRKNDEQILRVDSIFVAYKRSERGMVNVVDK